MEFKFTGGIVILMLAISLSKADGNADTMTWNGRPGPGQFVNNFHISRDGPRLTELAKKPAFCHELDCPNFRVVNKTEDYEERSYVSTKWVSTTLEGVDFKAASSQMFYKLFAYIQGKNAKKETIAMTAPVLISVIPGPGPACANNFTMSFFMSPKVTDPPSPTDKTVFLSELPSQKVYVGSFGGFASKESWLENAEKLAKALQRDSRPFVQDFFYTAGYDSPFKILGRHNEVWYMAQN